MAGVASIHRLDKIVLPSSVEFVELKNQRWNAGIKEMLEYPAGHINPMFFSNMEQRPEITFSTPQLSTLLTSVGVGGAALASSTTYFKLGSSTGNVARATTSHARIVIASSLMYWTKLTLPHNDVAMADVTWCAVWDTVNDPFVWTTAVALSGNLTATEYYGVGPWSINGTLISGVKEVTIDSGVEIVREGGQSELYDTFVGVGRRKPEITIKTLDRTNWAVLGLAGTALNGTTGVTGYARKFAANGTRVADATAQHVKFVGAAGKAIPIDSNGDETNPITDTIKCCLISGTDSVEALIGSVASAIT